MGFQGPPTIPPELQLEVIEYSHDDELALRNCSLVCNRWANYSRSQLWRKTAIVPKVEAGAIPEKHTVLVECREVGYFFRATSMEDATTFFTANPGIAKLVKKFRVDGFTRVTVNALSSLLTVLPDLVHLDIVYTDFLPLPNTISDLERERLVTKPVYTHQLDYVYFHRCNIVEREIDALLRVLALFSSIDTLVLEGPEDSLYKIQTEGWSLDPDVHLSQDVPHPPQPEVRRLVPEMVHTSVIGYLFNHTTLARNLKDLILFPVTIWSYADLKYMACTPLPPVSRTLVCFNFIPGMCMAVSLPRSPEDHQAVDAALTSISKACASVKYIGLHFVHNFMLSEPLDYSYLFDGFIKVLERMPPAASLKTLRIGLLVEDAMGIVPSPSTVPTAEVLKAYNWAGLERVLLTAPRCEVVVVHLIISFVFPVEPTDENQGCSASSTDEQLELARAVAGRMPLLYEADRLKVSFGEMRTQSW